jgi:hypothetical protein
MKPIMQQFFTKNRLILAAIVLIHVVFCAAIIQQVYKSLGDENLLSKLSLASFFNRPLSLTVSSTGSKPVAIGKQIPYTATRLALTQTLDTTKYQVFSESAQVTFAAGSNASAANALTIVDYTDKLNAENFAKQTTALKAKLEKRSTLKPITFDFGADVKSYAGFSYELPAPLSKTPTWYAEILVITNYTRGYLIKFVGHDIALAPAQLAALLEKLQFNDPALTNQVNNSQTEEKPTDPKDKTLEKAILQTQAAVKRVYNHMCANVSLTSVLTSKGLKTKYATICVANTANAFYFHKNGYLATQAQLVELTNAKFLYKAVNTLQAPDLAIDLAIAHKTQLGETPSMVRAEILNELVNNAALRQELAIQAMQLADLGHMKAAFAAPEIYVQKGKNNLSISDAGELLNKKDHYLAKIISTKDKTIILQVDQPGDYPVAKITQTNGLTSGTDSYVVGYAEPTTDADVFGTKSSAAPKVTKLNSPRQAGLGGAPIIDTQGEVLGLVSDDMSSDTGAFVAEGVANLVLAMRDKTLENVSGKTAEIWGEALANFFDQKYALANVKFTQALQTHADLAEANELKLIAQKRMAAGLDQTNDWGGLRSGLFGTFSDQAVLIFGLIAIIAIAIAMGSVFLINFIWRQGKEAARVYEPAIG